MEAPPIPFRSLVEDVLSVPLLPSLVPDYDVKEYAGVPDVRISVHNMVVRAVTDVIQTRRRTSDAGS